MSSEDADVAVPVLFVLALLTCLGVYNEVTREPAKPTPQEISALLETPERSR